MNLNLEWPSIVDFAKPKNDTTCRVGAAEIMIKRHNIPSLATNPKQTDLLYCLPTRSSNGPGLVRRITKIVDPELAAHQLFRSTGRSIGSTVTRKYAAGSGAPSSSSMLFASI